MDFPANPYTRPPRPIPLPETAPGWEALIARFWEKVAFTEGCWPWQANRFPAGYGQFSIKNQPYLAHRVAYLLTHGTLPEDRLVLHTCPHEACVRPDHLYLATQQESMERKKGLPRSRPVNPLTGQPYLRLSDEEVRELRHLRFEEGKTYAELAQHFHVLIPTISGICLFRRRAAAGI